MSGREWKPGDVGVIEEFSVGLVVAFNPMGCASGHKTYPVHVHLADGDWATTSDLRPLVVIDPEDREQVEQIARELIRTARACGGFLRSTDRDKADWLQAALREFADPTPRIEEPTGLGAVVADVDGHKWTRANSAGEWFCECGDEVYTSWAEFTATVRVLSDGVQP